MAQMKILIVGGGKIGFYLAKTLSEKGCGVSIIETDYSVSRNIADVLDVSVVLGDGTSVDVLRKAGAEECDTLIAITGRDEANLVICQIAKRVFKIPKTVGKVNSPKNVSNMKALGVDIAISSTDNIIMLLEREVDNRRIKELIPLNDGKAAVFEIRLPENYVYSGREIMSVSLPESCNIISITRGDDFIVPRGKTQLMSSDVLLIVSATSVVEEVRRNLKLKKYE